MVYTFQSALLESFDLRAQIVKKLGRSWLLLSALLFVAPITQAHSQIYPHLVVFAGWPGWEGNWLLGVTGGYAMRDQGELDMNIGHPASPRDVTIFTTSMFTGTGSVWGGLGGFQMRKNGWVLGAEVNVEWENTNETQTVDFLDALDRQWSATEDYKTGMVVGLSGRFGYEVNYCFMPYFRLGAETSEDELSIIAATNPTFLTVVMENRERQYRFLGGIGGELTVPIRALLPMLKLRVEYNYHSRGDGVSVSGFASDNATFFRIAAKPRTHSLKASLVWDFF